MGGDDQVFEDLFFGRLEQALVELRGVPGQVFTVCQVFEMGPTAIDLSALTAGLETHALATRSNTVNAVILSRSRAGEIRDRIAQERLGKRMAKRTFMAVDPRSDITRASASRIGIRELLESANSNLPSRVRKDLGLDGAELPRAFDADVEVPAGSLLVVLGRSGAHADGTVRQWLYLVDPRR